MNEVQGFEPMDGRLEAVLEALPAAIVSHEGRQRILVCAEEMPHCALESTFGFESHLGEAAPHCDFFLSAPLKSRFLQYLAEQGSSQSRAPARQGLAGIAKEMRHPESALSVWARSLILEYDLVVAPWSESRAPGVFIARTEELAASRAASGLGDVEPRREAQLIASIFSWMEGGEEIAQFQEAITDALCALPAGSRILHVGTMPDRAAQVVRLVLGLPGSEVLRYMQGLGWGGCLHDLSSLLQLVRDWCGGKSVNLSLDVSGQGVSDRLGVELYLEKPWHSVPPHSWEPCLRHLVEAGWSCKEKAAGLLNWPRTDRILSAMGGHKLLTGINHLKLTLEDGGVRSKAYMGAFVFSQ